ncbi:MAG TPA: ATP synthase subunit I [Gammaproteobacteria bacterium]|nr:ATP synthase subunit I [Gammaproteobacteria bacterium]
MAFADKAYRRMLYKMAGIQGGLVSLLIVGTYLIRGMEPVAGLLYGGAVTIATTLYSGWRFRRDTEARDASSAMLMASLYKGTVLRFLLVIALLVLGLRYFQLSPAAVIAGFVVAQAGSFLGPLTARWGR